MDTQKLERQELANSKLSDAYTLIHEARTLIASLTDYVPACEAPEHKAMNVALDALDSVDARMLASNTNLMTENDLVAWDQDLCASMD